MAYILTPEVLASITDAEMAFSTMRLLPEWEDIPQSFRNGNAYTELASALFYGCELPDHEIVMKEGFDPKALNKAVLAHLKSFGPKQEHKIAGVGFMIAQAMTIQGQP